MRQQSDITDDDNNASAIERQEEIQISERDGKMILVARYYLASTGKLHSMEALAELIGLNNADVAKSTKIRCFANCGMQF